MELTGLSLGQVLGVLGGAGAAVLVLYLLKLRRRRVAVPFVRLWETVLAEKQTTRLFSQLKRWISLLIALAVVALLALALGDPRYEGATGDGRTLVVLVDASASMQATDVAPSRFERAREEVRTLIKEMGPSDRMLIAQMDTTSRPVGPLTEDMRVLRDAVSVLAVTDMRADLRPGIRLALDVLRGETRPEVVVVTDGGLVDASSLADALAEEGVRLSWKRIGEEGDNVGISAFAVRRYPLDKSQSEVLVELWNPTERDRMVDLTLFGDGEPIDVQQIVVKREERLRRFFRNVSGVDKTLEAQITAADDRPNYLPADDRAFARLPERRRARVAVVTEGNLYLEAALLLDEYLEVTQIPPSNYPPEERFDVVIFDRFVPPSPPAMPALYLHPEPADGTTGPLEVRGAAPAPYFERVDERHPLTRWTALYDVNVASTLVLVPEKDDTVVAAAASGAPLIVAGTRNGYRMAVLAFDIRQSDFPLRVAWPLFLLNSIDWFVEERAGGYLSSYRTGETWHIPVEAGLHEATVTAPDGERRAVPVIEGRAVYSGTRTGFYDIATPAGTSRFAANLGPIDEARIAPRSTLTVGTTKARSVTEGRAGLRRELWLYLVLAVLAILALEWLTYHRRLTV